MAGNRPPKYRKPHMPQDSATMEARSYDVELVVGSRAQTIEVEAATEEAAREWVRAKYGAEAVILSVTLD